MIREIRVKTPNETGSEYLVIVKATNQGQKLVAFHGADTFEDALAGALNKMEQRGLQWKEDKPYTPR